MIAMTRMDQKTLPSWLETPPSSLVQPPTLTRIQALPFSELTWEDFERLCLRLVRLDSDIEHSQLYGVRGQNQHGIDLYARKRSTGGYTVYQCKNEGRFTATKIRSAVQRFRAGKWFGKADTLVLCSRENFSEARRADEVESQAASLKQVDVTFIPWDAIQLSLRLKDLPSLVDDFFGREWVRRFCGDDAVQQLGGRLDSGKTLEFRRRLSAFYKHVFTTHDPGLPSLTAAANENPLPLEERFILPDVDDMRVLNRGQQYGKSDATPDDVYPASIVIDEPTRNQRRRFHTRRFVSYEHRRSIDTWLSENARSVILGGPGSGKSSLLRFLAIDLLSDVPQLRHLAEKWGTYLPVWVPFAFWTKRIAESPTNEVSLNDAIRGWLESWSEEQLWPLVEQSLNDERLLLLVDGLDEHTNEEAAAIAISRLQVFIKQRNLPVVLTSRPQGFEKLGMQTAGWEIAPLSEFSSVQQEQLIRLWFSRLSKNIPASISQTEEELQRSLDKEIDVFKSDLQNSGDLRELAKVPLLLSLLIAHRVHHVQLPQSRFKAYESLIDYLIGTHPRRRRLAAAIRGAPTELSDGDMKTVLAFMAFCVHKEFVEGIVDYNTARKFVSDFLMDVEHGLGLPASDSRKLSQQILDIGESNLGLLVKKSQSELGFFHRVFQDYLAAFHIAALSLHEQLSMVEAKCVDPQWREVILSLLHITQRREDVRNFVSLVRKRKDTRVDQYAIELLLGEIAFGDFGCSTDLVHELAEESFTKIEVGSWLPQRERLLKHALDGLQSLRVRELVKAKLRTWFPDRTHWKRGDIFREMGTWSPDTESVTCLWKGLYDEDVHNMFSAAVALAKLKFADLDMGERLADLAWTEADPRVRSAAVKALQKGWPDHERLREILQLARKSAHPELQLASISARVERGDQSERDLKQLFLIGSFESGLDYSLRADVASTLARGWPNSPKVKSECLRALKSGRDSSFVEREIAQVVLIKAFHQDDDVAGYFAEQLNLDYFHPHFTFTLPAGEFFTIMSQNFKGHRILAPAVETYIERSMKRGKRFFYLFDAARVSPTPHVKKLLLSALDEYPHFIAPILLDEWGSQDEEIVKALGTFAAGPAAQACLIGKEIPQIISDRKLAYDHLLRLLSDPDCQHCSPVIDGLVSLESPGGGAAVLDTIFQRTDDAPIYAAASLIKGFPLDPRVRDLAEKQFEDSFGALDVIASVYREDRFFRRRVIEAVTPLPTSLRMIIAAELAQAPSNDEFAISVLRRHELEFDKEVKVQASVSYYNWLWSSSRITGADIDILRDRISKRWLDLGGTSEATFCGLAILKRLDVMRDARRDGRESEDSKVRLPISKVADSSSAAFLRTLLDHWSEAHEVFGEEFWGRFTTHEGLDAAWDQLCMFADEYTVPKREALAYWESETPDSEKASSNVLGFLDRAAPKSRLMRDYCLATLSRTTQAPHYTSDEAEYAIQLLGKNFAGDDGILNELMKLTPAKTANGTDVVPENVILALCEGWPRTEEFQQILNIVSETNQPLKYASYFQLSSRASDSAKLFRRLISYLAKAGRRESLRSESVSRPLIRRLVKDDDLFELFKAQLQGRPTASQKISLARLIALARGTAQIRTWCLEEIDRQLDENSFPEVGVDIVEGRFRPVAHALLDVMAFAGV